MISRGRNGAFEYEMFSAGIVDLNHTECHIIALFLHFVFYIISNISVTSLALYPFLFSLQKPNHESVTILHTMVKPLSTSISILYRAFNGHNLEWINQSLI